MSARAVYRCHDRGLLNKTPEDGAVQAAAAACRKNAEALSREGALMTAALYHYGPQLFLYYEFQGE